MYSWLQNLVQRGFARLRIAEGRYQSRGQFRIKKHFSVFARDCAESLLITWCGQHPAQPPLTDKADLPKNCWKAQWQCLGQREWRTERAESTRNHSWTLNYTQNIICAFGCKTPSIIQKKKGSQVSLQLSRYMSRYLTTKTVPLIAFRWATIGLTIYLLHGLLPLHFSF